MPYLIDSDWVIDYLASNPTAHQLLDRLSDEGISISIITYIEVYQGTYRTPNPQEAQALLQVLIESVPTVHLTPAVARRCALIRETLRSQGKRVNPRALDLIIAATALEHGLTLVTRNLEDYQDIPGLALYQPS